MRALTSRTSIVTTPCDPLREAALYRLLAWLSPAFPVGAFSYSHGIEAAAEAGIVRDRATLQAWIAAIVARGSGRVDADVLRDAYRAAAAGDAAALAEANYRGRAFRATAELALEAAAQGEAFVATCLAAWPEAIPEASSHPGPLPARRERKTSGAAAKPLAPLAGRGKGPREAREGEGRGPHGPAGPKAVSHAAAFGAAAARARIALDAALLGYLQAFAATLMSAGLRLGLVGQTDGQRILAALEPVIVAAAKAARIRDVGDFGSAAFAVDLASMAHETQYTRLFRS